MVQKIELDSSRYCSDTKKIISSINKFKPDYIIDFMGQGMVAQS